MYDPIRGRKRWHHGARRAHAVSEEFHFSVTSVIEACPERTWDCRPPMKIRFVIPSERPHLLPDPFRAGRARVEGPAVCLCHRRPCFSTKRSRGVVETTAARADNFLRLNILHLNPLIAIFCREGLRAAPLFSIFYRRQREGGEAVVRRESPDASTPESRLRDERR